MSSSRAECSHPHKCAREDRVHTHSLTTRRASALQYECSDTDSRYPSCFEFSQFESFCSDLPCVHAFAASLRSPLPPLLSTCNVAAPEPSRACPGLRFPQPRIPHAPSQPPGACGHAHMGCACASATLAWYNGGGSALSSASRTTASTSTAPSPSLGPTMTVGAAWAWPNVGGANRRALAKRHAMIHR